MKRLWTHFQFVCTMLVIGAAIVAGISLRSRAVTPGIINYQGRVQVKGADFTGSGQFKFALVNPGGTTTYWSNDGTSTTGNEPTNAVTLTVTQGLYGLVLGDTSITNMTVIPASAFSNADVRLRIWFNDGTNGSQLLSPDQRIAASGYAMVAAAVDDGTITTAKIAAGAVTAAQIAPGVIPTMLPPNGTAGGDLTGAYPNPTIVAGAVTAAKIASLPKCHVFNNQPQNVPSGGNPVLTLTTNRYDTDSIHPTPGTRLTCNTPGVYRIFASIFFSSASGGNNRSAQINVNGTQIAENLGYFNASTSEVLAYTEYQLNKGDYVELSAGQNSGSTITVTVTSFGISYVP